MILFFSYVTGELFCHGLLLVMTAAQESGIPFHLHHFSHVLLICEKIRV